MTDWTSILSTLKSSHFSHVTLANGSSASIIGCDAAIINIDISLTKVLCLPNFPFNLLLVSQLTCAYNCVVFPFLLTIVFFRIF